MTVTNSVALTFILTESMFASGCLKSVMRTPIVATCLALYVILAGIVAIVSSCWLRDTSTTVRRQKTNNPCNVSWIGHLWTSHFVFLGTATAACLAGLISSPECTLSLRNYSWPRYKSLCRFKHLVIKSSYNNNYVEFKRRRRRRRRRCFNRLSHRRRLSSNIRCVSQQWSIRTYFLNDPYVHEVLREPHSGS